MRALVPLIAAVWCALSCACSAPEPLRIEAPAHGDLALVVVVRDGDAITATAMDAAAPLPLPALAVGDTPTIIDVIGYDVPLHALGWAGAPGPLSIVAAPLGRSLFPAAHADRRVVDDTTDGAWAAVAPALADVRVAIEPACAPLTANPIDIPVDTRFRALYRLDDSAARLIIQREDESVEWYRVAAGALTREPDPIPGLIPDDGAVGPDGVEWVGGLRASELPELWSRPAGGVFTRVPDSPAQVPDGSGARWLAAFDGGVWTMSRTGVIERFRGGAWDARHDPDPPVAWRSFGAITAVSADGADAILPFVWDGMQARTLARVRGGEVTTLTSDYPLPSALVYADTYEATIVGTATGRVYRYGARSLDELAEQTLGSVIQGVVPARHGPWRGVIYSGINGFLRELYEGAEFCQPTGLWFNVGAMAEAGRGWVATGPTQPPARRPSVAWIARE